jgi:hypothetical protein
MQRVTRSSIKYECDRWNRHYSAQTGSTLSSHFENEGLVIEMKNQTGTYTLGFKLTPREALGIMIALDIFQVGMRDIPLFEMAMRRAAGYGN